SEEPRAATAMRHRVESAGLLPKEKPEHSQRCLKNTIHHHSTTAIRHRAERVVAPFQKNGVPGFST
ncbi:hypothetical protein KKB83_03575, partial [Patescibacteria group bacterium]|nr:hypothetical protein [Patescibacteria group bacterium]